MKNNVTARLTDMLHCEESVEAIPQKRLVSSGDCFIRLTRKAGFIDRNDS